MPSVFNEHEPFTDLSGKPIVNGKIYIGVQNQDPKPVGNRITIYSDRDLTTPIDNPQTTDATGRSTNKIWVPGKYSIRIDDSTDTQAYQNLDAGGGNDASDINYTPTGTGVVATTVDAILKAKTITAFEFMTAAEIEDIQTRAEAVDVTAALVSAAGEVVNNNRSLHLPAGTYNYDFTGYPAPDFGWYIAVPSANGAIFSGDGIGQTILKNTSATAAGFRPAGGTGVIVRDMTLDNNDSTGVAFRQPGQYSKTENVVIKNQAGSNYGCIVDGSTAASLTNVNLFGCTNGFDFGPTVSTNYVTVDHCTVEMISGKGLRCNLCANVEFFQFYLEPENSAGNIETFVELTNNVNVDFYGLSSEPSGVRVLTDDAYISIGANNKNINFYGGRVNHQAATANKAFFKVTGANNRSININGMLMKSDATGMTVFEGAATGIIGTSLTNITTDFSNAFTGVNQTAPGTNTTIFNWADNNNQASHELDSIGLLAANILGDINLVTRDDQFLVNCSGTLNAVAAAALALKESDRVIIATTTQLEDITDPINTSDDKIQGYGVYNETTAIPLWAVGNADGSVWINATGATVHTPV